jgi:hypothetical protein
MYGSNLQVYMDILVSTSNPFGFHFLCNYASLIFIYLMTVTGEAAVSVCNTTDIGFFVVRPVRIHSLF